MQLPTDWSVVGGGYLIGPGANLTGANLTGANLAGTNLAFANLAGVNLTNANLKATDLSHATLTGVISANLTGTPAALPAGWSIVGGQLVKS